MRFDNSTTQELVSIAQTEYNVLAAEQAAAAAAKAKADAAAAEAKAAAEAAAADANAADVAALQLDQKIDISSNGIRIQDPDQGVDINLAMMMMSKTPVGMNYALCGMDPLNAGYTLQDYV